MKSRSGTRCGRWALAPTLLATLMLALPVAAQPGAEDPEIVWREGEVAPPPAWSTARMVRIDMPIYSEVMVGVDVDSVTVGGKDGYGVAVVQAKYENAAVTFTLSYTPEGKLGGLFFK